MYDRFLGMGPSGDRLWSIGFVVVYRITYLVGRSAVGTMFRFTVIQIMGKPEKASCLGA